MSAHDKLDRLIGRALRMERDEGLPENFAAETAAFVESASREATDRFESWAQRVLIAALIIAAIVTLVLVGGQALALLSLIPGSGWVYTVALCVGLTLGMQHFAKRFLMATS